MDILELQKEASIVRTILPMGIILINSISTGTSIAFSTTAAVVYRDIDVTTLDRILDDNEISWLMSIMQISMMIFVLLSGFVNDALGRKKSLILGQVIILIGWVSMYLAPTFPILISGRFFMGVGTGIVYPINCLYLSEIALIRYRGTMSVMNTVTTNFAFVYSLILTATLSLEKFMYMSCLPPALFLAFSYFLPESPLWLMKKERVEDAEKAMLALRGPQYVMATELDEIKSILACSTDEDEVNLSAVEKIKLKAKEMSSRAVLLPILVMLLMLTLQPMSGSDTVSFYSLDIFRRANVKMNNYVLSILVNSGFTLGYLFSAMIMTRVGRKLQFISSGLFMAVSLATLGFTLDAESSEDDNWKNLADALLPICVICTGLAYGLGVGPVLFSLLGEILPQKVKSVACSLILSVRSTTTFVNIKIFPFVVGELGLPMVFWIHSGICVTLSLLAAAILPETQGLTLTELSNLYEKKKPKDLENLENHQTKVEPWSKEKEAQMSSKV